MKTVCIYHSIDLDGWMSAAIVKHWFNQQEIPNRKEEPINTLDFIGYNYGQPIPDLSEYDKVIMCDISFPKEEMYKLWHIIDKKVIWIDHHISAINDNNNLVWNVKEHGLQDTKYSACELTWEYFFPDETIPEIVRLLGLYDSFRHKGTDEETKVLEFQYGARQCISNYEEAYRELIDIICCNNTELKIWNKGKTIYEYLCTEAKQSYKNGFEIWLHDTQQSGRHFKFICINKERFNPINFGIDYHKDGYDGAACFHYANGMYNFSLYNDNGLVDCSVIAKQFGGGGHKGAAGFRLTKEEFNDIIK
jgi:uncharacterized protein